jgi:alpha-galactosidase
VQNSKDIYVAMFNLSDTASDVAVSFAALGLGNKVIVRDLWKKQDLGRFKKEYHQMINKHGAVLLKLSAE